MEKKKKKGLGERLDSMSDSDNPTFDRDSGEKSREFPEMYKQIKEHNKRQRDKKEKKEKKGGMFSKLKSKIFG